MTWNPVTGCLHGCEYCYARGIAHRFAGFEPRCGGEDVPETAKNYRKNSIWNNTYGELLHVFSRQPMKRPGAAQTFCKAPYPYDFEPTLHRYRLDEPVHKRKGCNIFVGSMADIFGEWVPDEWIQAIFDACDAAPQHRYMFLTKNWWRACKYRYKENWWIGQTITHDAPTGTNDKNLHLCYGIPKAVEPEWKDHSNTFISIEPIHSAIPDLPYYAHEYGYKWVIVGAESGNRKNKVIPDRKWIEKIIEDCALRKIPLFMKDSLVPIIGEENMLREFPEELRHIGIGDVNE